MVLIQWSANITDRRTDRRTTCDRKTALCPIVHRAVKTTLLPCIFIRNTLRHRSMAYDTISLFTDKSPVALNHLGLNHLSRWLWKMRWECRPTTVGTFALIRRHPSLRVWIVPYLPTAPYRLPNSPNGTTPAWQPTICVRNCVERRGHKTRRAATWYLVNMYSHYNTYFGIKTFKHAKTSN